MTEKLVEEIGIDFDRSTPRGQMTCGFGLQMSYGSFDFDFPHRDRSDTKFHIPNVPAWQCPTDCPRSKECTGILRLLTKSTGDLIFEAVMPYYKP